MSLLYWYFILAIVLDHIHLACPIVLAWSSPIYRRHMVLKWEKFILMPVALVGLSVFIGFCTSKQIGWVPIVYIADWRFWITVIRGWIPPNWPFVMLVGSYIAWNAWHFGSQHYGVARLSGWQKAPRWIIVASTLILMPIPIANRVMSLGHWLTDIVLTVRVLSMRRWQWILIVMIIGFIGFVFKGVPKVNPQTIVYSVPFLIALRCGLGFWHFLMSRWVWSREGRSLLVSA